MTTESTTDELRRRLQRLEDKDAIRDAMSLYARAVDRLDSEALREVYHPDAIDDHADYRGDLEGLIDFIRERTASPPQIMHFLGQSCIEFADDVTALVETYFMTAHTLGDEAARAFGAEVEDGQSLQLNAWGRYVDRFEKRDGMWKIAQRTVIYEARRVTTAGLLGLKDEWEHLRRDSDDLVYRRRRELGIA
ncbi:nuclear transport factor 2 family protein [Microbacterium sp. No. 7]|uniref:nuclear transport factor 2 family protein n=1 Tax=Microbacterium sp. No. 7 TaxID=1714373 RepID=UPI0006CFE0F6|nr:nuclear transport factor 2 family protein [Microbacterium sp. No. 7]ALJ21910.1 hypothetical protein AOA12_19210 [Microbacterium sp. No. 7]